jgi:hypothetical protein
MTETYQEHEYLLSSDNLSGNDKKTFEAILNREVSDASLLKGAHHGVKPWLLIHEYDTRIQSGYFHDYYEEIISLCYILKGMVFRIE